LLGAAIVAGLAGCGSDAPIAGGGRVVGDAVTVYVSVPEPGIGTGRDMIDAAKLAVSQAGGQAGGLDVNFAAVGEGSAGADAPPGLVADAAEQVVRDPQVMAVIGSLRSQAAMTAIPLFNAAGILHVSPGAGYAGFTGGRGDEPERWYPSGRMTFARVIGDDVAQAQALLAAAGAPRVAVEAEAGRVPEALAEDLAEADRLDDRVRIVSDPGRAGAVIYAGSDLESAAGVADALALEAPGATLVFPDELTRAGLAEALRPAVRRRAVMVSSAPEPGSSPDLRAFEQAFEEQYDRAPGPYAVLAWRAARRVLDAMDAAAPRANLRTAVIDEYFDLPRPQEAFTAFRPLPGGPEYLR
jgi:ABC-type branched-subunit amino acid transport system substrate-binding protein